MGCSPSTVARPNDANTTAITADETIRTGHEKNGNLFYCIKIRRSRLRRCSLQNGCDTSIQVGGLGSDRAAANGEDLCNQALLNPMQTKNEANYEKISSRKKDSIVTVAALGNFTHRVVKRATGTPRPVGPASIPALPQMQSQAQITRRPSTPAMQLQSEVRPNVEILAQRLDVHYEGYDDVDVDFGCSKAFLEKQLGIRISVPPAEIPEAEYLLPNVVSPNLPLKALLVFSKEDKIFQLVQQACNRREVDISIARTLEATTEKLTTGPDTYQLIVLDGRYPNFLDAVEIAKTIRLTEGYNCATIVALVKRSFFESDATMTAFLDAGINTCIVECYHLPYLNMELKQIISTTVKHYSIISTQEVLYTALNRIKDVVIITDNKFVVQYVNQAAAHLLGVPQEESINKHLSEYFISDLTQWTNALKPKDLTGDKPLDFAGTVLVKGKNLESTSFPVRARQLACYGRVTTHLIFNVDMHVISQADSSVALSHTRDFRGSFAAARRSSDLKGMQTESRRASAAKLAAMPLEAPITKIINLLSQLQENCSLDEAHLIDRVLDFLKYESLYSPQMKDIQMEDPIATELIGALITGSNVHSSRRSSNDSTIRTAITRPTASLISTMKAAPLIMDALKESLSWEFDIFRFEKITEKRPLLYLGMEIFDKFKVFTSMRMDQTVFKNWFVAVESRYHAQNAYHNSTHAADVLQAIGVFLSHFSKKEMNMDCLEESSALIAAVVHDIDHPGRSSAYLCNSNNPLAILYNDVTVLENHHAAYFFKLTLCDDSVNIFKNLEPDIYKSMRNIIIDMILATEMTRHFEHLAKFVSVFGGEMNCNKEMVTIEEDSALLMRRMLIKVADVSNPSRPYLFCVEWAQRIAEEYFQQTEEEKTQNMPIVMPMFDRCTCSIPKSQIGFIEYIVMDMLLAWDNFIDMPELITYTRNNLEMWKHLEEEGVRTIADVKRRQAALTIRKTSVK